jgi:hypothetical protein
MSNKKLIFISSASRNTGSISKFDTILPTSLFNWDDSTEYGELTLVNFTAKQSYYNINSLKNSQFTYNDGNGDNTVTIPEGNYSVKDIATQLTTLLNAVATGIVWTISINLNTLKYNFVYTGTATSSPVFTPILHSFDILGFNGVSRTITTPDVSDKIVSIGNEPAVFLHCNYVFGQNKLIDHPQHNHPTNLDQIFAKINIIGTSFFGTITYEEGDYKYTTRIPNTASTLVEFSIRDKEGDIIVLSEDYDMVLELEVKKKKPITLDNLAEIMVAQILK